MGRVGKGELTAAEEARCLNVIGDYVARRDAPALTRAALAEAGVSGGVADVAVLFWRPDRGWWRHLPRPCAGVARTYVIVEGRATRRPRCASACASCAPRRAFANDAPEADVFSAYLRERHGLRQTFSSCARRTPATT